MRIRIWAEAKLKPSQQDPDSPILINDMWIAKIPYEAFGRLMKYVENMGFRLGHSESTVLVYDPYSDNQVPLQDQIKLSKKGVTLYEKMDVEIIGDLTENQKQDIQEHFKGPGKIIFLK